MLERPWFRGLTVVVSGLLLAPSLWAQNVVLDQGTFRITLGGRDAGTEEFAIRRAGMGSDGTVIANATVNLEDADGAREIQVVLSADPTAGTALRYRVEVQGAETMDLSLSRVGRRYISVMRSPSGEEERELPALAETRILEIGVAHQYYFLRSVREGDGLPVIEPRTRRRLQLRVSASTEEELPLGRSTVTARRVVLEADGDRRIVWYDRQGRVLRVEIPGSGYVAERTDLVG